MRVVRWRELIFIALFALGLSGCGYISGGSEINGHTETVQPIQLSVFPTSLSLLTGESATLAATGGTAPYSYVDGSGYLNSSTDVYSAPLNIAPFSESITVNDSQGNALSVPVKVQAFQTKDTYNYATGKMNSQAAAIAVDPSGNLISAGSATVDNMSHWLVRKSTNLGVSWTTVDDFNYSSGRTSIATAVASDPSGILYVVGYGYDSSGNSHWLVRKSTDGGSTWTTVDVYAYAAGFWSKPVAAASDPSGDIFVAGVGVDSSGNQHWIVRVSTNTGATWTTADDFVYSPTKLSDANAVAVDSVGDVYVSGYGWDSSSIAHWIVRKSSNGGSTWTTMDDFNYTAGKSAASTALAIYSPSVIYAGGYGNDSSNVAHWIVRKSIDGGSTWTTMDDFNYVAGKSSSINALAVDAAGNVFAAGYGLNSSSVDHWVVRTSSNGGSTWSTADDYTYVSTQNAIAYGLATYTSGPSEYIFTAGYAVSNSVSLDNWIVRKSSNLGGSWATSDNFNYVANEDAEAVSTLSDSSGNLYAAGYGTDSSGNAHWIVRKSTDGGTTWTTVDNYTSGGSFNYASAMAIDKSGDIFVVGTGGSGSSNWIVRESTNSGASWSTVDNFSNDGGAESIAIDNSGNIYVAGHGYESDFYDHWFVRKSTDGGSTWSTVDTYNYESGWTTSASAITVDKTGNVYVAGDAMGGHWLVRKSTDGGTTWTTEDNFQYGSNFDTEPTRIAADSSSGNVYIAGWTSPSTMQDHWLVRRSTDSGSTWTTVDDNFIGTRADAAGLVVDSSGVVYVSGLSVDSTGNNYWIVKRSKDGGTTWTTVDDVSSTPSASNFTEGLGLATFGTNQVSVVGSYENSNGSMSWLTRLLSP